MVQVRLFSISQEDVHLTELSEQSIKSVAHIDRTCAKDDVINGLNKRIKCSICSLVLQGKPGG